MKPGVDFQRRHVVLAALLALGLMVASVAAVVGYAWQTIDRTAKAQETHLVGHYLASTAARLEREAASAAEWDDAYRHVTAGDATWLRRYYSNYYEGSFAHDLTVVFDGAGKAFFGGEDGQALSPARLASLSSALSPAAQSVQSEELSRRRKLDRGNPEASSLASRAGAVRIGDQTYLVAVVSVLPSTWFLTGETPTAVVITGRRIDAAFDAELERTTGISGVRLDPRRPTTGSAGIVPLKGFDGQAVAALRWTPSQPAAEAAVAVARPAAGILLALLVSWSLIAWLIRRLLRTLAARDQTLLHNVDELSKARDAAQSASVLKSQFIANISHEIRTPLNGVLGMAQAMARDDLNPAQRERLTVVQRSGGALLALLNDVLDLAKIEAGKLELVMAPFDLAQLVDEVMATFEAVADAKGLAFDREISAEAAGTYVSDAPRIRQVLHNLVGNALKFTSAGGVRLTAHHDGLALRLEVRDSGPGIPPQAMARLFGKFEQGDASATRRYGGTGLGLAISAELTARLGGVLEVESVEGQGALFRLVLPLGRIGAEAPAADVSDEPADEAIEAPALRVLAAEDNPVNRLVLTTLLEQLGITPRVVEDGALAVEAWRDGDFDVVLMDVQMPVMDGIAAARTIRDAERRAGLARTPIVALTANALTHQREEYLAAGMDYCLAKPIEVAALVETLSAIAEGHALDLEPAPAD